MWFLFLFLFLPLFAEEEPSPELSAFRREEELIAGLVSPLMGSLVQSSVDLIAHGCEPTYLRRTRAEPNYYRTVSGLDGYLGSWIFTPHVSMKIYDNLVYLNEPTGCQIAYKYRKKHLGLRAEMPLVGFTNTDGEHVSSMFDSRLLAGAQDKNDFWYRAANGTLRFYKYHKRIAEEGYYYFLTKEEMLNGKKLLYHYKGGKLDFIEAKDPTEEFTYSKISFLYSAKTDTYRVYTDTGSEVQYVTEDGLFISSPFSSQEKIKRVYESDGSSTLKHVGCGKDFQAVYDIKGRVTSLSLMGDEEDSVYQFTYKEAKDKHRQRTKVVYPEGTTTVYVFNKNLHPDVISFYDVNGTLRRQKKYVWGGNGWLHSIENEGLSRTEYELDQFGNPQKEIFSGDLTGSGKEESYVTKRFFKQDLGLLRKEFTEEVATHFSYLLETNLITHKIVMGRDGLLLEEKRKYDPYNNLVEILTEANGERKRTAIQVRQNNPGLHLPEWIEEFYYEGSEEKLLKKTHFHYNERNLISDEDIYDDQGLFAYRLHKEYNKSDQVVLETNPLGETAYYTYDDLHRLISRVPFSDKLKETMTYDRKGRITSLTKGGKTTRYKYDRDDNLILEINPLGQEKHFLYDLAVKKPKEITFGSTKEFFVYDGYGRMLSKTDALSRITSYKYNAYDAPTEISYPDGTKEILRYYTNGKLREHTDREGVITLFTYDSFGRMTSKEWAGGEEKWSYNALHLLSHTDREGHTTHYSYDGAGRKAREEKCGRITTYTYNSLGGLETVTQGGIVTFTKRDFLDRVTLETKSDLKGNLFFEKRIVYDSEGNEQKIITGNRQELFFYDAYKRLVEKRDGLDEPTTIFYKEDSVLEKTTIDPSGLRVIELFDIYERLVEKRIEKETVLSREKFTYDLVGNLLFHEEDVFQGTEYKKTLVRSYTYDVCNRRISSNVSDRITKYTYTPTDRVASKIKYDGVIINYTYNPLGDLETVCSSKGDIDYRFVYDKCGRLLQGDGFIRKLDPFGNILEEKWGEFTVSKTYDDLDRVTSLTLPGISTITYSYDFYLREVGYEGQKRAYTNYNLAGELLQETYASYTRDGRGQITELTIPHFTQVCVYDVLGNPIKIGDTTYIYDALSQITKEYNLIYSKEYTFDSHYDDPNQEERKEPNDPLGSYDSLDRLVKYKDYTYIYDALDRRISKTRGPLLSYQDEHFLYDGLEEIASYNNSFNPQAVKIGPPARPSFLLLHNSLTVPLYDVQGSLKYITDIKTETIHNSYSFDSFGNSVEVIETLPNPWRYALKHYDPESELIYFGKRYYNPITKQWITEDPAGDIDTLNLYAFVRNNPLRYVDYTGLFSEERSNYNAFIGSMHGVVDFAMDYLHSWESSFFHLGASDLDITFLEKMHMTNSFLQSQEDRTAYIDQGISRKLSVDLTDPTYSSFRSGSKTTCEIGSLIIGGYGAVRGLAGVYKLSRISTQAVRIAESALIESSYINKNILNNKIWTSTKKKTSVKNAYCHWKDHRKEFPNLQNAKQYVDHARSFVGKSGNGLLTKLRTNGEILIYETQTNTFVVYSKEGLPKTMFKPREGMTYLETRN